MFVSERSKFTLNIPSIGSAEYLTDVKENERNERYTLIFQVSSPLNINPPSYVQSTHHEETIPANVAKDNPSICSWTDREFGPTHVVSQVSDNLKGQVCVGRNPEKINHDTSFSMPLTFLWPNLVFFTDYIWLQWGFCV